MREKTSNFTMGFLDLPENDWAVARSTLRRGGGAPRALPPYWARGGQRAGAPPNPAGGRR